MNMTSIDTTATANSLSGGTKIYFNLLIAPLLDGGVTNDISDIT